MREDSALVTPMVFAGLLVFVSTLAVGLVWALLRLGRRSPKSINRKLELELSHPHLAVARAFSEEDLNYLFRDPELPEMIQAVPRDQRQVRLALLRDIRRDFYRTWSFCRQLAPMSEDPDFAVKLFKQFVDFHGLYVRVWWRGMARDLRLVDIEALAAVLGQMRETAGQLVRAS